MPLREEFRETGNVLFRWRSYLPLILLPPVLAAFRDSSYRDGCVMGVHVGWFMALAGMISVLGILVRCATVGFVPSGTSGRNVTGQKADALNTSGMYSMCRHPLYLGNGLILLGVTMFVGTWWLVVLTVLAFWLYYERIMFAEEEFIREKFGDAYLDWASNTPAFIPALGKWRRPEMSFSLRTVVRREISGFFGTAAVFTFLECFRESMAAGGLRLDDGWLYGFCIGTAVYIALLAMKKMKMLDVRGR